jgi:hypothetical protein
MKYPLSTCPAVNNKTNDGIKNILCYHLQSHKIQVIEKTQTNEDDITQRFWLCTYICVMLCDQCGWKLCYEQIDPSSSEWMWMRLAQEFEKQVPVDCNEARNLRIIKDIMES